MTTDPNLPIKTKAANVTKSFARRNWVSIVWLAAAIIGLIVIVYIVSLFVTPKVLSVDTQANLLSIFVIVYVVGLVRSQLRYRLRGASFGALFADEHNTKQRLMYENRTMYRSGNLYHHTKMPLLGAIFRYIRSQIFWFLISGVTWPFFEIFVQLRYLLSSDARRAT